MQADQAIVWQESSYPPLLNDGQIHVWRLDLSMPAAQDEALLDAQETARLCAIGDPVVRDRYLATRLALRQVLAAYLDCKPSDICLLTKTGGKPWIPGGPEFNLSHCGELGLLAVSRLPVGIDVEIIRRVPRRLAIARRVLGDEVADQLGQLPESQQDMAFLAAWTAMEARQKCHGEGVFGRRIDGRSVGSLAFRPDERHLAQLAWMNPASMPDIHYFVQATA